jgi:hypothetical protein
VVAGTFSGVNEARRGRAEDGGGTEFLVESRVKTTRITLRRRQPHKSWVEGQVCSPE